MTAQLDATLPALVGAQLTCRACPLRVNGPVPLHVPLHVRHPRGLLVLPRPFSDSVTPATDPRRTALARVFAGVGDFAVTYLASCWSDPGQAIPDRSVRACRRHRTAEVAALQPAMIVTVGDQACKAYAGLAFAEASGQAWQHGEALVVPLPERHQDWSPTLIALLQAAYDQVAVGVEHDLL